MSTIQLIILLVILLIMLGFIVHYIYNQRILQQKIIALQETATIPAAIDDQKIAQEDIKDKDIQDNISDINNHLLYTYNPELDHVINIVFNKNTKLKYIPEITFEYRCFILNDKQIWQTYKKCNIYHAKALKIVISLVKHNSLLSNAHVEDIALHCTKFATHYKAMMQISDSQLALLKLQQQIKQLVDIPLELNLFILNKQPALYSDLDKLLISSSFIAQEGRYYYYQDSKLIFQISAPNQQPLVTGQEYTTLAIVAKLHHLTVPQAALEIILDFTERYMQYFEARILNNQQRVFGNAEYSALCQQISRYLEYVAKHNIELGSELIMRFLP